MPTDVVSLLQTEVDQLMIQHFSTYSYLSQRHPLQPPREIPGLRFTSQKIDLAAPPKGLPGEEDTTKAPYPLQPQDPRTFEEAQNELAEDLILKTQQIQQLIAKLPGIDQDESQQAEDIKTLIAEVDEMEKARRAKRREMHQLVKRLDAVVGGMSKSINYSPVNGHTNGG
ncbi:Mediator of RNA polymerase II transcription subunit 21 [Knufia obscura]|uniref:Mediator of RNA polymerase II transcription subunit 21 n=2 Tax=Knufia TaxID=430999 RepID=A0AAN8I370_9EURO|nr:Mediator of RNA polymerase II transcription subunit 21 [Knufia obscura]KAK5949954.1 Mediator of RNA polymerase II transcription subunit 21 [Knufia fluminis]